MKKVTFVLVLVLTMTTGFGQKNVRQTASNFLRDGKLDKAIEAINQCIQDASTSQDPKTWLIRGNIYFELYNKTQTGPKNTKTGMTKKELEAAMGKPQKTYDTIYKDSKSEKWIYSDSYFYISENGKIAGWKITKGEDFSNLDPDPIGKALESYKKTTEFDTKKEYSEDVFAKINWIRNNNFNQGVEYYNNKHYKEAMTSFESGANAYSTINLSDTLSLFYAAACATMVPDREKAKDYYLQLIKANYKSPTVYMSLSDIYRQEKDSVNALRVAHMGQKLFPNDLKLFLAETNIYLTFGNTPKALRNLKLATQKDTTNPTIFFALGTIYDKIANDTMQSQKSRADAFEQAVVAYKNAIRLNPKYFDPNYNIGALYVNKAASINDEANKLPLDAEVQFKKLKEEANQYLVQAAPYLEVATEIQPNDLNTLYSLKQIYVRTNQTDKLKVLNNRIDALQKK